MVCSIVKLWIFLAPDSLAYVWKPSLNQMIRADDELQTKTQNYLYDVAACHACF